MSFKVHMHSLGVLTHPALDVTGLGPLTAEAAHHNRTLPRFTLPRSESPFPSSIHRKHVLCLRRTGSTTAV